MAAFDRSAPSPTAELELGAMATGRPEAPTRSRADDFETTLRPHYAPLLRRLVLVLGNVPDAEDVAQEAYLRAFRAWERFDGADPRAWLHTIALRLAFNELRRRRRLGVLPAPEPSAWAEHSDPDLWAALQDLDRRMRAAVLLSALDGYTQREIAAILDAPEGTVASWISRGRAALRGKLADAR